MVADLPLTCPRLKVACVKWSYRQPPKFGYCPIPDAAKLKALSIAVAQSAESCLKFFHSDCAANMKSLTPFARAQILGNVDSAVVTALLTPPKKSDEITFRDAIRAQVKDVVVRVGQMAPDIKFPRPPAPLEEGDVDVTNRSGGATLPAGENTVDIFPKLIKFDADGAPVNAQDQVTMGSAAREEVINWQGWWKAAETQKKLQTARAKSAALSAMLSLSGKSIEEASQFLCLRREGSHVRVFAKEEMNIGAFKLVPVVSNMGNLQETSIHPHAAKVSVSSTDASGTTDSIDLLVTPEFSLPKSSEVADDELQWTQKHYPWLFWAIKRSHVEETWNCELESFVVSVVTAASFNKSDLCLGAEPVTATAEVELLAIVNSRHIRKDEEVVLRCAPPIAKTKPDKVKNWRTEALVHSKKARTS